MTRDDIQRRALYPREGYRADDELSNRTIASEAYGSAWVRRVRAYEADTAEESRRDARQCRACFYLRGGGMSCGYERVNCRQCDAPMTITGGAEVEVCAGCSERFGMCCRCGGDIDGNTRRRKLGRGGKR